MDGAATEKYRSARVMDLATTGDTISCWDAAGAQNPFHHPPDDQVLQVARRIITMEGLVHHSKYLVFDTLVDRQPMELP